MKITRILAIDYGLARIGLALSDEKKWIASPLMLITAEKTTKDTVEKIVREITKHQQQNRYELAEIVVGLPLLLSGKSGFLADEVRYFVDVLGSMIQIPIVLWDERLTTVQADRAMREGGLSRKKRSKGVDLVAAVILLQSYLDYIKDKNDEENAN